MRTRGSRRSSKPTMKQIDASGSTIIPPFLPALVLWLWLVNRQWLSKLTGQWWSWSEHVRVRLIAPRLPYRHDGQAWYPELLNLLGPLRSCLQSLNLSICLSVYLSICFHRVTRPSSLTSQSLSSALFPCTCLCLPVTQTRLQVVTPTDNTHISFIRLTCLSSS